MTEDEEDIDDLRRNIESILKHWLFNLTFGFRIPVLEFLLYQILKLFEFVEDTFLV